MTTAIALEDISKLYRLGVVGTGTISHDLNRWWHRVRGKEDPYARVGQVNDRASGNDDTSGDPDYVWALKDINFEVQEGEILGIIGHNGAGKSTLLKLLSRVTAPTSGFIRTRGRIASLLEVGTGFHPELTGRENIYLNGAILGMRKHEIDAELDNIVDFSGCAKYVDTPTKRYSSGMTVRLGFAIAAHLRSEILIIDEVLAVGDWDFQKRCIEKMQQVARSGRTLLFVSHNMASVRKLCQRSVILNKGTIDCVGDTTEMIERYMATRMGGMIEAERTYELVEDKPFQITRAYLSGEDGEPRQKFSCSEAITLNVDCLSRRPVSGLYGYVDVSRSDGTSVLVGDSFDPGENPLHELPAGRHQIQLTIPARTLGHGSWQFTLNFTSRSEDAFNVDSPGVVATCELSDEETRRGNTRGGYMSLAPDWIVQQTN